jgi:hypothetical protein
MKGHGGKRVRGSAKRLGGALRSKDGYEARRRTARGKAAVFDEVAGGLSHLARKKITSRLERD